MSGPKHLWSGDWQHDSEAASEELARRGAKPGEEESDAQPTAPQSPRRRRPNRSRTLALTAVTVLLVAGAAYGLAALLGSAKSHHPSSVSVASAPAPQPTTPQPTIPQPTTPQPTTPQPTTPQPTTPQPTTPQPTTPVPQPSVSRPSTTVTPSPTVRWLGMQIDTVAPGAAVVETVRSGSEGDQAGLEPGDVIVELNGQSVHSAQDVAAAIKGLPAGRQVQIQISYGSLLKQGSITLAAPPTANP
jgi:membrane-associated protease RseP (regulator of RpoE activity)